VSEALTSPDWTAAMKTEYSALMKNSTWTLVPLPTGRKAIGCKWIFRIKYNSDGSIEKNKARLVAQGFSQKAGQDYSDTFSPVTIRTVISIAVSNKWQIHQIDIDNAFLNGTIKEDIYMKQPPGFEHSNKQLVCKLQKALYGLKQAPRAWFDKLSSTLLCFGFHQAKCDTFLFIFNNNNILIYLLIYVDDILITSNSPKAVSYLISNLNDRFSLKELGPLHYFLGI
jgi:histone deacetylase 1/2